MVQVVQVAPMTTPTLTVVSVQTSSNGTTSKTVCRGLVGAPGTMVMADVKAHPRTLSDSDLLSESALHWYSATHLNSLRSP